DRGRDDRVQRPPPTGGEGAGPAHRPGKDLPVVEAGRRDRRRRWRLRSGFATLVGRPNVGKSTLLNRILGRKVAIVSDKPQTTRTQVRGVLNRPDAQVVFVDTPGIHKPRTLLGERLNDTATSALGDVDVTCLVLDATGPVGRGDRFIAEKVPNDALVVLNKVDAVGRAEVLAQLERASAFDLAEYF